MATRFRVTKRGTRTTYTFEKPASMKSQRASSRSKPATTRRDLEQLKERLESELAKPTRDFRALCNLWQALRPLELAGRAGRRRCCLVCRALPLQGLSPATVRHREGCEVGTTVRRAETAVEDFVRR